MTFKQNNLDDFTKGYLTEGLDNCLRPLIFLILWVTFEIIQSLNRLPYQI